METVIEETQMVKKEREAVTGKEKEPQVGGVPLVPKTHTHTHTPLKTHSVLYLRSF